MDNLPRSFPAAIHFQDDRVILSVGGAMFVLPKKIETTLREYREAKAALVRWAEREQDREPKSELTSRESKES